MFWLLLGSIFVGAGAGLLSSWQESQEATAEDQAQIAATEAATKAKNELLEKETSNKIEELNAEFDIKKSDALTNAGKMEAQGLSIDTAATNNESSVSVAYNKAMSELGISQEQLAHQEQAARVSFDKTQGSLAAQMGSSGIRADSTAAKILVQNQEAFDQDVAQAKKTAEMSSKYSLSSAYAGLEESKGNINSARTSANEAYSDAAQTRSDYSDGGRVKKMFDLQVENIKENTDNTIDYTNTISELTTQAYERQLERDQWNFIDAFSSIFSGASSGLSVGNAAADFYTKWIKK